MLTCICINSSKPRYVQTKVSPCPNLQPLGMPCLSFNSPCLDSFCRYRSTLFLRWSVRSFSAREIRLGFEKKKEGKKRLRCAEKCLNNLFKSVRYCHHTGKLDLVPFNTSNVLWVRLIMWQYIFRWMLVPGDNLIPKAVPSCPRFDT